MSVNIVHDDAVAVLKQHQDLIERLKTIKKRHQRWEEKVAIRAKELAKTGAFTEYADDVLFNGLEQPADHRKLVDFLCMLYTCVHLTNLNGKIETVDHFIEAHIRPSMEQLSPAQGRVRWFFASAQKKADAAEAYNYLHDLLEGSYSAQIESILKQAARAEEPDRAEVIEDFSTYHKSYYTELKKVLVGSVHEGLPSIRLGDLIAATKPAIASLNQCRQAVDRSKKHIEDSVIALAAKQAMSTIREIPVEELRSSKENLRIKALRDSGYETLADVYSASVYQLSSVRGISSESADAIKRRATEMVDEARKTQKIKLSADARSEEASKVIAAVFAYQKRKPDISKYEKLKSQGIHIIEDDVQELSEIGSGINVLFSDHAERENWRSSIHRLTWLRDNSFDTYIGEAAANLNTKLTFTNQEAWQSFIADPARFYTTIEEVVPGALGNGDSLYGLPEELAQEIQDEAFFPDGLLCTLRRYQEWGVKYVLHQEKALLGDEMGLGKTIQAIAAMVSLKNTGEKHFLVVCPASVIANWFREIRKSSKLRATIIHGNGRTAALREWIRTGGVAVTSYETTGHLNTNIEESFRFGMLVVDEAHYIKNINAKCSENVRKLCDKTDRVLFMTGTALENKVDEMISLIDALRPDIAQTVRGMAFMARAPQFREAVAPVYYRRKREDVLTELPELVEKEEWCTLLPQEEHVYEDAVLNKHFADARRVSWSIGDPDYSSKAQRLKDLADEAASDGRKILVFSFFLDTIAMVAKTLGNRCLPPINGSVPPQRRQQIIDDFEKAPAGAVLPAQIVSGGTGLNIQSASVVIICEPQLKPSLENQAIARAYRMGQARNVFVFRLLCEDTIDERITDLLESKQEIFEAFADKSVAAQKSVDLDEKTLGTLIQEEIDRINNKKGTGSN